MLVAAKIFRVTWCLLLLRLTHQANVTFKVSIRIASSLCSVLDKYQEDKKMPEPPQIMDFPADLPFIDGVETISFAKCPKGDSSCKGSVIFDGVEERKSRITGGMDANQLIPEFPWDVKLRNVWNWGTFFTKGAKAAEIENNNLSSIAESFYCTGVLYNKRAILLPRLCAIRALKHAKSGSRLSAWFARKKFVSQNWVIPEDQPPTQPNPKKKNADIIIPEWEDHPYSNGTAIIKFLTDIDFPKMDSKFFRGLEIPDESMEFAPEAVVAGWGRTTYENQGPSALYASGPTKLQKLNVKQDDQTCLKGKQSDLLEAVKRHDMKCFFSKNTKVEHMCFGDYGAGAVCDKNGKKYMCGMYFLRRDDTNAATSCNLENRTNLVYLPFYNVAKHKAWYSMHAGPQDWL